MLRRLKDLVTVVRAAVRTRVQIMCDFDKTERELDISLRRTRSIRRR